MKPFKYQTGFTLLEVILLVVVVAMIVGSLVYAYDHHAQSQSQPTAQTKSTPSQPVAKPKPASINDAAAADFVKQFYVQYATDIRALDGGPDSNAMNALVAQGGTQQFVDSSQTPLAYDPVICGHESDISATNITITAHSALSATKAQVTVGGTGGTSSPQVAVIPNGSSFKIDGVTCPGL